jgi:hypothetical protein
MCFYFIGSKNESLFAQLYIHDAEIERQNYHAVYTHTYALGTRFKLIYIHLGSVLLHITNNNQPFLKITFPFGFQYLVIIYINFKFNLNCIKHYIHGG